MEPEKIVQQFNNVEWDSNGDPLYSYDQMLNAVKQALQQTHVSGALPLSEADNKYYFAREMLFTLRSCHAITPEVYLHWIQKLIDDEAAERQ